MKKITLSFILVLCVFAGIFSQQRSEQDALLTAKSFFEKQNRLRSDRSANKEFALSYTALSPKNLKTTKNTDVSYYVFNIGENNGFIIVSGDVRAKDILGYSYSGTFDIDKIPDNFRSWLSGYEREMEFLFSEPLTKDDINVIDNDFRSGKNFASSITPLLGGVKWNQDSPYNDLCPVIVTATGERAVAGCVATAMAQIMKYHKWPDIGVGSNSYKTTTLRMDVSADFSLSPYDWGNMADGYNSQSTEIEKNAVATLVYHCGVAVNMDYWYSSSAYSSNMINALIQNFKYDSSIQVYKREFYPRSEWVEMIKSELNVGRPIFYSGNSNDIGHIFICDGYDAQDLFHFNWGWGGMSDGYFELSALSPPSLGIGGGNSGGFNYNQNIIIGVQKQGGTPIPETYLLYFGGILTASPTSINRTAEFSLGVGTLANFGINKFTCDYGVGLFDTSGNLVEVLYEANVELGSDIGWTSRIFNNLKISSSVSNGDYKLYPIYKVEGQSNWSFIRGKVGKPQHLDVNVTSTTINILSPDAMPDLSLGSIAVNGNLYKGKKASIDVTLTNNGGEYNSNLRLVLKRSNGAIVQYLATDIVNIGTGETKTIGFVSNSITAAAGNYNLSVMYDSKNDPGSAQYENFSDKLEVSVLETPSSSSELILPSVISLTDKNAVNRDSIRLSATIKNTGGYFDGSVIAYIYDKSATGSPLAEVGRQLLLLDKDEEREVIFEGNTVLPPDEYLIEVRYYKNDSWKSFTPAANSYLSFRLVEGATGINDNIFDDKITVYPNPVTDYVRISSNAFVNSVKITDLTGKQVLALTNLSEKIINISIGRLPAGTYIIQVETAKELITSKFIKK